MLCATYLSRHGEKWLHFHWPSLNNFCTFGKKRVWRSRAKYTKNSPSMVKRVNLLRYRLVYEQVGVCSRPFIKLPWRVIWNRWKFHLLFSWAALAKWGRQTGFYRRQFWHCTSGYLLSSAASSPRGKSWNYDCAKNYSCGSHLKIGLTLIGLIFSKPSITKDNTNKRTGSWIHKSSDYELGAPFSESCA